MNVEMRRQKVFEECRLRYTKVLGKKWGDEAKRKAAEDKARRDHQTITEILPTNFQRVAIKDSAALEVSDLKATCKTHTDLEVNGMMLN